jgi:hypothetical protein
MRPSQLTSFNLPEAGTPIPAGLAKAAAVPLRVEMRNIGPVNVILAHDQGTLQTAVVFANAYFLAPERELVVVLAPGQPLYAVGDGVGAQLSIALSEALPTKWMEA